jgi:hypothetical protein
MIKKSEYGRFTPAANGWKTKYLMLDTVSSLLTEEEEPST